ncbi:MAG: exonuclease domain-containing protein [Bacteroidetes bacterium]|nr:exonuclease domain-containing protein [Bacteroidota bacterium]
MYAVIDVETTGLSARFEKITEIAIFIHDGHSIIEAFVTLINPEKIIPYRITQMTGINNKMVEVAPRFLEVAKKIIELTEDKVLVGHNVAFDYNFLKQEFGNLGYDYKREKICTAKLSRKIIPFRKSYGLGNLCKDMNINNPNRHRAAGDATATARLFELLISVDPEAVNGINKFPDTIIDRDKLNHLPEAPGVYYFYNADGDIIYVGKSVNIYQRVLSHFSNNTIKKEIEMKNNIADVSFELTGNDLVAMLLESDEIKKHKPFYNTSLRRSVFTYGLFDFIDDKGYLRLKIDKNDGTFVPLLSYTSQIEAKEHLFSLVEKFGLCQKLCGLYKSRGACFQYHIRQCNGACICEESAEDYNQKVGLAIKPYLFDHSSFLVIDKIYRIRVY